MGLYDDGARIMWDGVRAYDGPPSDESADDKMHRINNKAGEARDAVRACQGRIRAADKAGLEKGLETLEGIIGKIIRITNGVG